jgi:hypothetical protein
LESLIEKFAFFNIRQWRKEGMAEIDKRRSTFERASNFGVEMFVRLIFLLELDGET